uniref:Uncharacterized protein n=1 Tax=Sinorhizobium meliloti (strain SM11) TaxID=707241 RepID=Q1WLC9_SINMM|nr:hypothetical protein [Sinorhizobium meliloti]
MAPRPTEVAEQDLVVLSTVCVGASSSDWADAVLPPRPPYAERRYLLLCSKIADFQELPASECSIAERRGETKLVPKWSIATRLLSMRVGAT